MITKTTVNTNIIDTFTTNSLYKKYASLLYDSDEKKNKIGIAYYSIPPSSSEDRFYIILPDEEYRPDLLSQKFYNTTELDWFICIANKIKDPLKELTSGKKIIIPSLSNLP